MNSVRLHELDAARGIAMLLVCTSHFLAVYTYASPETPAHGWLLETLILLCRCASPTFILVSGIMLGFQADVRGRQFAVFRLRLLDRALFLVSIGHILVWLSLVTKFGPGGALTQGYITDTIAFCVMVGVFLVPGTRPRYRLLGGICLYLGSWSVWQVWSPEDPLLQTVKGLMFGGSPYGPEMDFSFPLFPWFGIYLAGSAIGGWLQRVGPLGMWRVSRRLLIFACAMFTAVFVIKAGLILRAYMGGGTLDLVWYRYVNPSQKHPPGPFYLLAFTGTAFLLLSLFFSQPQRSWVRRCRNFLEPIGKNALPVFIFQYFVYWTLFYLLVISVPLLPLAGALGLLLLSLLGIVVFARLCQRYKVAQLLTVGTLISSILLLLIKTERPVQREAA
jgi:uncharacterized membrane protein